MKKLKLKAWRINAGLTQREAAERLGVSTRTIWQWENGKSYPNPKQIDPICELYKTEYDSIIFFDKNNALSVENKQ